MSPHTVILIDDHPPLRAGIASIVNADPDFQVVGEASTLDEGARLIRTLAPDFAVVDLSLPDGSGNDLIRLAIEDGSPTVFLVLSMHARHRLLQRALDSGARGYLLKESGVDYLIAALHALHDGDIFIDPKLQLPQGQPDREADEGAWNDLGGSEPTERERDVFRMLALGQNSKQIGVTLGISFKTVDNHRSRIMQKLELGSIADLVRAAIRTGVIDP